jgi:hypothetical protein
MTRRRVCTCGCGMCTGRNGPCSIGEVHESVNADSPSTTADVTTPFVPSPRPGRTTRNGRPATTDPPTGDTYTDLLMVLGIAGAFGLILAVEAFVFCLVLGTSP